MGSRGRSIRLRIYFLVAIPLIAMVGLLAYVAGTSINNAINLDRAPNLINATSLPTAEFVRFLQDERAAAMIFLFQPTQANLAAYNASVNATNADQPKFVTAMDSPGTKSSETPAEAQGIQAVIAGLSQLPKLRDAVTNQVVTPLQALGAYSAAIQNEPKLFLAEADSLTNARAAGQALGLIATVSAREALSQEHALLSGVLAGKRMTPADRAGFSQMAAIRQGDFVDAEAILDPANLAIWNGALDNTLQKDLTQLEGAVSAGLPFAKLPITLDQWNVLAGQLLNQYFTGGVKVANAQLADDRNISNDAKLRVAVTGGIGLAGLLITIAVTILVGRGIIRRLGGLERTALQLAEVQLPEVVGRLRRGEDVDVAAEAPALRVGLDEIGRVGQAFDLVRQTAIRAAVDEAKLRRGLNDVFRSLARRSQSLLHRQLTLLDQMERRASDPEALDDLFRLDHLTTRMRRHAEGLVILAGAPPGRGWSNPVRMVDVMRGAIAEVEDYARVSVATRSQAALSGSAVADVIHLLAELIENATTLSPPYTSVRVSGETVASGFVIEVEDRGLGMGPQRLAELNERLANPPEFNPSDSEQLGLFVVSQLAKRHGIRVTLKASPYGGTSAIVLIAQHLVMAEEALRPGLPGEPAAITMAPAANGSNGAAEAVGQPWPGIPPARGVPGLTDTPGVRISGPLRRSLGSTAGGAARGADGALGPANGTTGPPAGADDLPRRHHEPFADVVRPDSEGTAFDVFMPRRPGQDAGDYPESGSPPYPGTGSAPYPGTGSAPYPGTGSPPYPAAYPGPASRPAPEPHQGTGSAPYPVQPAPLAGWTGRGPASGNPASPGVPGNRVNPGAPATPMTPVASASPPKASSPPWELSGQSGPLPAVPAGADPPDPAGPGGSGEFKGLPRRVKQASLAPQLRVSPPPRPAATGGGALSSGPTPAEIRSTMSALQRGWQEGRSQQAPGSSGPGSSGDAGALGSAAPASTAPDSAAPGSAEPGSTADEEAQGGTHGT